VGPYRYIGGVGHDRRGNLYAEAQEKRWHLQKRPLKTPEIGWQFGVNESHEVNMVLPVVCGGDTCPGSTDQR